MSADKTVLLDDPVRDMLVSAVSAPAAHAIALRENREIYGDGKGPLN
jgi:alpha-tubulin suppressor-like RCC1 family protein